jgi:hypothetical protein
LCRPHTQSHSYEFASRFVLAIVQGSWVGNVIPGIDGHPGHRLQKQQDFNCTPEHHPQFAEEALASGTSDSRSSPPAAWRAPSRRWRRRRPAPWVIAHPVKRSAYGFASGGFALQQNTDQIDRSRGIGKPGDWKSLASLRPSARTKGLRWTWREAAIYRPGSGRWNVSFRISLPCSKYGEVRIAGKPEVRAGVDLPHGHCTALSHAGFADSCAGNGFLLLI